LSALIIVPKKPEFSVNITTKEIIPAKNASQAIKLIECGLETFPDTWFSTYTSYLFMGRIYESIQEYKKAYDRYLKAMEALDGNGEQNEKELEGDLCWMLLHLNSFQYSEELEERYRNFEKLNEFAMAKLNNEFRRAVIRIVILLHYNQLDEAKEMYKQVKAMCVPNYIGKLYNIYARHKYKETLKLTPETKRFIRSLNLR